MYSISSCWYCDQARRILEQRQITFEEISVDGRPDERIRLKKLTGQRTVPQIFIGDLSIGGCSDLQRLIVQDELDQLLSETAPN